MTSDSEQIMPTLLNNAILVRLHPLLLNENQSHMQTTLWGLSNIACHNSEQVVTALISNDIFATIVGCMNSSDLKVRREAIHTVSNAMTSSGAL